MDYQLNSLEALEAEAIFIFREAASEFRHPVMLYSVGKDSSVLLHLARKAFLPGPIPFPLMHIDTGYKFPEMIAFRDRIAEKFQVRLIVESNDEWINKGCHPAKLGADECCRHLKTEALLKALEKHGFDAAFGGARREEEKSRAKERIFSVREKLGRWDPREQRPAIGNLFNTELSSDQSMRVFPLSNWSELDVWRYIQNEQIEVVPIYFSHSRSVIAKGGQLIPEMAEIASSKQEVRFRSLGCMPCTGAVASQANSVGDIIEELQRAKYSERQNRLIDHTGDSSMEDKKRQGYF